MPGARRARIHVCRSSRSCSDARLVLCIGVQKSTTSSSTVPLKLAARRRRSCTRRPACAAWIRSRTDSRRTCASRAVPKTTTGGARDGDRARRADARRTDAVPADRSPSVHRFAAQPLRAVAATATTRTRAVPIAASNARTPASRATQESRAKCASNRSSSHTRARRSARGTARTAAGTRRRASRRRGGGDPRPMQKGRGRLRPGERRHALGERTKDHHGSETGARECQPRPSSISLIQPGNRPWPRRRPSTVPCGRPCPAMSQSARFIDWE